MKIDVLGVEFDDVTEAAAVAAALEALEAPPGSSAPYIVTPNPEIVQGCRRDAAVAAAVRGAQLVLPDGIGILYAAKILGRPLKTRVPGIDFAAALLTEMARAQKSVYLLGAKPGVAETAAASLVSRCPGLVISGCADGYFTQDEPALEKINAASPDLLLVCLGAPKQELWMARHASRLNVRLCIGLGGALDIWSGAASRAPRWMRRLGLEWLYRLLREPKRIARMAQLPLFLFAAFAERLHGDK